LGVNRELSVYLVTGGAGFIGSKLVDDLLARKDRVIVLDALTYSGRRENLSQCSDNENFEFVKGSICDLETVPTIFSNYRPAAVINVAAETHVDRSIDRPSDFIDTNIKGTDTLLQTSLKYWQSLERSEKESFRYLQISTDEVYGSIEQDSATESAPYRPNSPYAASKAAADHLVRSYNKTYGLPTLTTHGSNTYGPRQFPEKLIPLIILRALSGQSLPVYGDGRQIREWIHVDDHVTAILTVLEKGLIGESYNIGSGIVLENIELVKTLCRILDKSRTKNSESDLAGKIQFVQDRPGHDHRYFMDGTKAQKKLGWCSKIELYEGLVDTIDWYLNNTEWWEPITNNQYNLDRLGAPDS